MHDNARRPWQLDGQPIYCLHGVQYETVDDRRVHLTRCPDCGGMGVRTRSLPSSPIVSVAPPVGMSFDARLEMMET